MKSNPTQSKSRTRTLKQPAGLAAVRARLEEMEQTLAAIRAGEVDALVVNTDGEEKLFTLRGADTAYRELVEIMPQGALTLHDTGAVLYANRSFAAMLGVRLERITTSLLSHWVYGESDAETLAKLLEQGAQSEPAEAEIRFRHASGAPVPAYVALSPLPESDGGAQFCLVATDLTTQKQAELTASSERKHWFLAALHEATQAEAGSGLDGLYDRLARVVAEAFEAVHCVIAELEPARSGGRWRVFGEFRQPGAESLLGRQSAASFGAPGLTASLQAGQSVPPAQPGGFFCVPQPSAADPRLVLALRLPTARAWTQAEAMLLEHAADRIWNVLQTAQAQQDLRASEDRFRLLAETIPQLAWMAGADGSVFWLNQRWFEFTGAGADQLLGWAWTELVEPDIRPEVLARWRAALQAGTPFEMEFPLRGADGPNRPQPAAYTPFLARAMPVRDALGQVAQWFGTCTDISAQRQAIERQKSLLAAERSARAEAERVSHMKDEFVATLSHELRTPLHAILGWSSLLAKGPAEPAELRQGLASIERNARVQVQMIEDLLDLNRVSSGKLRLELGPTRLGLSVEAAFDSLLPTANAKGVGLECDLGPAQMGDDELLGDPDRLQQIVWNLLSNAVKFTPSGGRVRLQLERGHDSLRLIVTDTGVGMATDFLPYVFERFRQADQSTTRKSGGLGLGLAIVKSLVELHGGSVHAHSDGLNQGARFVVEFPRPLNRVAPPAVANNSAALDSRPSTDLLRGLNVVYVDDEADGRTLASRILTAYGADVRTCASAEEARQLVARLAPDVLVADVGMPGEDGYSLIQSIRLRPAQEGGRTPAAALTAMARPEDRHRALAAGFQAHIPKPVEAATLVTVVADLARKQAS